MLRFPVIWQAQRAGQLTLRHISRHLATTPTPTCDNHDGHVIIAGAGPSGLTLALWLSRYGVSSIVLDKAQGPPTHPQAHYINNRTMEVLRPLSGLASAITSAMPPLSQWRTFRYCFSMTGDLLGEVDHFKGQDTPRNAAVSPEPVAHLPQHQLLPLMLERVTQPGSRVALHWGTSVTGCETTPSGVTVHAMDAQGKRRRYHGRYLAAADGAHSLIRQQLGIPMSGQSAMMHLINIHFTCPSLGQRMLRGGTGPGNSNTAAMLYLVFNADVVGVVVAHNLEQGEFVAQVPFYPPLQSPTDYTESMCRQLVAGAAGLPLAQLPDLAIHQVRPWIMSAVVADRFHSTPTQARPGAPQPVDVRPSQPLTTAPFNAPVPRMFLLGDAAHRFPPAGGFGMNTGIQDAHNLAWKLAMALGYEHVGQRGLHLARLLESYEAERKPVAQSNCDLSVRNWGEAVGVPAQLGLDPRAASALDTAVRSVPFLPTTAGKALLEGGLALGRALTTSWTPLRPWQQARVNKVFESGVTLRLQFPREDLGFCYTAPGALVVPETQPEPQQEEGQQSNAGAWTAATRRSKAPDRLSQERGLPYIPSTEPGSRLPHVWLRPMARTLGDSANQPQQSAQPRVGGAADSHCPLVSTLDVVAGEPWEGRDQEGPRIGPVFTLFVDDRLADAQAWLDDAINLGAAAAQELHGLHLPLQIVHVVQAGQEARHAQGLSAGSVTVLQDAHGAWHATMQLPRGGVLLVRPDGHVAWRHRDENSMESTSPEDAKNRLWQVVRFMLTGR